MRMLLCFAVVVAGSLTLLAADKANAWFAPGKLHQFEIQISAENWEKMQPKNAPMGGPGGGPPGMRPPREDGDKERDREKERGDGPPQGPPRGPGGPGGGGPGAFGIDFTYVPGKLIADGEAIDNIGIRFKGNSSYMMAARGLKRPFHLDFNRYDEDKTFHNLKSLSLSNNAMDESHVRELLAYECFRAAGVPCSNAALATVTLHVPEKYDHRFLGIYTVVESVDKTFLKRVFGTKHGMLLKPERLNDLEYLGDGWSKYQAKYGPKTEPTSAEKVRHIEFLRLIHRAKDAEFATQIGKYLDVDEFLRFLACESLLANMDSFLAVGHNFYMFLNPETDKFVFIPWDHNHAWGGFPMAGRSEQQIELSVEHPFAGNNTLINRILAIPEHKEAYMNHIKKLAATAFTEETLHQKIDALEAMLKDAAAREKKEGNFLGRPPRMPGGGTAIPLKEFISRRAKSVAAQLAGESKGYVPERVGPPGMQGQPRDKAAQPK